MASILSDVIMFVGDEHFFGSFPFSDAIVEMGALIWDRRRPRLPTIRLSKPES